MTVWTDRREKSYDLSPFTAGNPRGSKVYVGYTTCVLSDKGSVSTAHMAHRLKGIKRGEPKRFEMFVTVSPGAGQEPMRVSSRVVVYKQKRPSRSVCAVLDVGIRAEGKTREMVDTMLTAARAMREYVARVTVGESIKPEEPNTVDVAMYMAAEDVY